MSPIRIGTAGWSVSKEMAESFSGTGTHLSRYALHMNAVEINSSFYHSHRRSTYERWAASVPQSFKFSIKLPKQITHANKLVNSILELEQFIAETDGLGDKRGPILVQLPPSLAWKESVSQRFFSTFRARYQGSVVCEPRHQTWFTYEADCLLREFRIGRVAADPAVVPKAAAPGGCLDECYYRWHGSPRIYYSAYDERSIQGLWTALQTAARNARAVWCIFDNTAEHAALRNAMAVTQMSEEE